MLTVFERAVSLVDGAKHVTAMRARVGVNVCTDVERERGRWAGMRQLWMGLGSAFEVICVEAVEASLILPFLP